MKAPISWLKDFVDIDVSPEVLADKLVSAGFEVEEIIYQAKNIINVKTAKIVEINQHPNADKLLVTKISLGTKYEQIVTAAHNIKVDDIVPVCLDGAVLPSGKVIKNGELRGVPSNGMFCGGSELGLTEADYIGAGVDGILILKPDTKIGVDINEVLGTDDVVLDVAVTANRPDCNSILGIAREVAAVLGKACRQPINAINAVPDRITNYVDVQVLDKELCPRYMARCVTDVKIGESPEFIKRRLKSVGLRPINNIVDITNYVLIEIGQPMHAFDQKLIEGGKIIVRRAVDGEAFTALDGSKHTLNNSMLVISDQNKTVALAGVMGGENSGVNADTKTIIFESARFARDNIRRTSRSLNLRSDSSSRYEKGVDFLSQQVALERALTLIQKFGCGTIVSGTVDSYTLPVGAIPYSCPTKLINDILGIKVPYKRMVQILNSLQFKANIKGKTLNVQIPAYREDIICANDLAEEIIRVYGYNKIKSTLLKKSQQTKGGKTLTQKYFDKLKNTLVGLGANEVVTYSFITPKAFDYLNLDADDKLRQAIKLLNPLGEDVSVMRTTLVHSMLNVISSNLVKGNKEGRFFEIAKTFTPKALPLTEQPIEKDVAVVGVIGKTEDFFTLKGIVEGILSVCGIKDAEYKQAKISYFHDGRAATVSINGKVVGSLGEIHPDTAECYDISDRVFVAELDVQSIFDAAVYIRPFFAAPKFPSMVRDLALVIRDTIPSADIIKAVKKCTNDDITESVKIFDVYKGASIKKGYESIALSITFRAADRTLKDTEINEQIDRVLRSLKRKFRARLR